MAQLRLSAYRLEQEMDSRGMVRPYTRVMAEYLKRSAKLRSAGITFNPEWTPEYSRNAKYRWVESPKDGLRFVGTAHDIVKQEGRPRAIDHTGWFTDTDQNETIHGQVYQLPARDGQPLYVPGVSDECGNNGAVIDFHSSTSDKMECALWADSMAERYAKQARDDNAKEQARMRMEDLQEEIKQAYTDLKTLCREVRANCDKLTGLDALKALIRREVRRTRREVSRKRKEYRDIEQNGLVY